MKFEAVLLVLLGVALGVAASGAHVSADAGGMTERQAERIASALERMERQCGRR
jgi:hypothetical protein